MNIVIDKKIKKEIAALIPVLLDIFAEIGLPLAGLTSKRLQRMAEACMAIGGIKTSFSEVRSVKDGIFMRTREIIQHENAYFGESISLGSYDDIRRKDLKLLVLAHVAVNSADIDSKPTNDGTRGYCLSDAFAQLLRTYKKKGWKKQLVAYRAQVASLEESLTQKRELERIPVHLPSGKELLLSYGAHNELQKAIIESFLPCFGKGAEVLYVGDTQNKHLHMEEQTLKEIGVFDLKHEELPDIIAYNREKNLLFLIEAYNCTGQWNETRLYKIKNKLASCKACIAYITAFQSLDDFKSVSKTIAWETEVWLADIPEHMIHYNGWKFLELHR